MKRFALTLRSLPSGLPGPHGPRVLLQSPVTQRQGRPTGFCSTGTGGVERAFVDEISHIFRNCSSRILRARCAPTRSWASATASWRNTRLSYVYAQNEYREFLASIPRTQG